jgi:hypothetical protein
MAAPGDFSHSETSSGRRQCAHAGHSSAPGRFSKADIYRREELSTVVSGTRAV